MCLFVIRFLSINPKLLWTLVFFRNWNTHVCCLYFPKF